jgi:hypothetical protein
MRRTFLAGLTTLLLTLAPPAAASATTTGATTPADGDTAYVRVGHLVPNLPEMRMSATLTSFGGAERLTLTQSATYGTVGPYQPLTPGTYSVAVTPAGAPPDAPSVLTGTITAEPGDAYTVIGLGTPSSARLQAIPDDISAPGPGVSKVRVINASSLGEVASVSVPGGPTLVSAARFSVPSGYTDVPVGTWAVEAVTGSITGKGQLAAAPNSVYTLLVLDDGAGGLEVRAVQDATGAGQVPTGGAATGGGWAEQELRVPALAAGTVLVGGSAVAVGALVRRRRALDGARRA